MLNYLLGQKVSIVSRKVQTTRFSTKGILNIKNTENNKPDCQIIIVDTPGLFEPKKALEKHIVKLFDWTKSFGCFKKSSNNKIFNKRDT